MGHQRAAAGGLAALWLVTILVGWWRYADIPRLVGYDEAIIHDAALGWAKTGKLAAPSMEGTPLGETFAIYPPLYPLAQGLVYRYFGFSALTLKVVTRIGTAVASLLGLLVLRSLWLRRVFSGGVAAALGVLWLTDWIRFWSSRQGRMESWEVSFGLAAALVLVGAQERPWRWYAASALVGLALGTHFSAVMYYVPLVLGLVMFRRSLGWARIAVCAAIPVVAAAAIWWVGHGARAFDALEVFQRIYAVEFLPSWKYWLDVPRLHLPRGGWGYAGPAFWLVPVAVWASFVALIKRDTRRWGAFLCATWLALLVGVAAYGTRPERVQIAIPLILLSLGVGACTIPARLRSRFVAAALALGIVQFGASLVYVSRPTSTGGIRVLTNLRWRPCRRNFGALVRVHAAWPAVPSRCLG